MGQQNHDNPQPIDIAALSQKLADATPSEAEAIRSRPFIEALVSDGWTRKQIGEALGVDRRVIASVLYGERPLALPHYTHSTVSRKRKYPAVRSVEQRNADALALREADPARPDWIERGVPLVPHPPRLHPWVCDLQPGESVSMEVPHDTQASGVPAYQAVQRYFKAAGWYARSEHRGGIVRTTRRPDPKGYVRALPPRPYDRYVDVLKLEHMVPGDSALFEVESDPDLDFTSFDLMQETVWKDVRAMVVRARNAGYRTVYRARRTDRGLRVYRLDDGPPIVESSLDRALRLHVLT